MPLLVEIHAPDGSWREVGKLGPGLSGSLSDNKPDGRRDVYEFRCSPDDSEGVLYLSAAGADALKGEARIIYTTGMEEVARFKEGEYYLLQVKTDQSPEPRRLRFRHVR